MDIMCINWYGSYTFPLVSGGFQAYLTVKQSFSAQLFGSEMCRVATRAVKALIL